MNYHYIEFMLRERQRLELEECERNRILRKARDLGTCFTGRQIVSVLKCISISVRNIFKRKQHNSQSVSSKRVHFKTGGMSI